MYSKWIFIPLWSLYWCVQHLVMLDPTITVFLVFPNWDLYSTVATVLVCATSCGVAPYHIGDLSLITTVRLKLDRIIKVSFTSSDWDLCSHCSVIFGIVSCWTVSLRNSNLCLLRSMTFTFLLYPNTAAQRRASLGTLRDFARNPQCLWEKASWWRHQMETLSALLAIYAGNSPLPGEFPAQRPVTRSFDVFFDLRLNKRLSKQSWGWWYETPSRPLWRHCHV